MANPVREKLESVLQNVANVLKIKNSELVPNTNVSVGDGFVGQIYTGAVKNKDTGEIIEVIIKKPPDNELASTFDFYTPMFKNENLFYCQVLPGLEEFQKQKGIKDPFDNIPRYLCGNMGIQNEYIAMENLKTAQYALYDKTKFLDEEHLEFIFKTYGKFHALSFVLKHENPEQYNKILKDSDDLYLRMTGVYENIKTIKGAFRAAVATLDPESDKVVYEKVQKYLGDIKQSYVNSIKYEGNYNCITHGDCWSNNMLFKYNVSGKLEDMKLLDFQLMRNGTPVHDLSYFFYSGASKTNFDKLDDYLKLYYESFSDFTKRLGGDPLKLFPFDIVKKEWKENALLGVFMAVTLWQLKLVKKNQVSDIITDETPMKIKREAWEEIVDQICKSDTFRERTKAILIHAAEYGVI